MTKIKYRYNNKIIVTSSRLCSNPSFISGLGSIFNIAGNYFDFNYSKSEYEADIKAIERDWRIVGENLKNAIESVI